MEVSILINYIFNDMKFEDKNLGENMCEANGKEPSRRNGNGKNGGGGKRK